MPNHEFFLPNEALHQAYIHSNYYVWLAPRERICLSVGKSVPSVLEHWLHRQSVDGWALLSAWNPCSKPLSVSVNQARHVAMQQQLRQQRVKYYPAVGESLDGTWRESSLLLLNPATAVVETLAHRFGQLAWLSGTPQSVVTLAWSGTVT